MNKMLSAHRSQINLLKISHFLHMFQLSRIFFVHKVLYHTFYSDLFLLKDFSIFQMTTSTLRYTIHNLPSSFGGAAL